MHTNKEGNLMTTEPKTYEKQIQNLFTIGENIMRLQSDDWEVIDIDNPVEAYYSLRAINVLLTQIKLYCKEISNITKTDTWGYFDRKQKHIQLVQDGEKSRGYLFSMLKNFMTDARSLLDCDNDILKSEESIKNCHGGSRSGAGRKVKRPTKQIRIDEDLAESFKMMSDYYQSLDDDGRIEFDNRFSTSGLLFPNG